MIACCNSIGVSVVEQQQQSLIETVKNTLNSFQALQFSGINDHVGAILSQLTSLEAKSQNEMKQMLDNQASTITQKMESKIADEDAIKQLFCGADASRKLLQLHFDKDVATKGAIYREYVEYKELYHYLQDLGMNKAFKDKIALNRASIGVVNYIRKRDKHLPVSQQVLVHLMVAIQRYFGEIIRTNMKYCCEQILDSVMANNKSKENSNEKIILTISKHVKELLSASFSTQ